MRLIPVLFLLIAELLIMNARAAVVLNKLQLAPEDQANKTILLSFEGFISNSCSSKIEILKRTSNSSEIFFEIKRSKNTFFRFCPQVLRPFKVTRKIDKEKLNNNSFDLYINDELIETVYHNELTYTNIPSKELNKIIDISHIEYKKKNNSLQITGELSKACQYLSYTDVYLNAQGETVITPIFNQTAKKCKSNQMSFDVSLNMQKEDSRSFLLKTQNKVTKYIILNQE